MAIDRPPTLTPEEMDQLLQRLANTGARLTMTDPRVTSVQNWILGTLGGALVVMLGWGVTSINDLNRTVARVVTQNEYRDQEVAHLEKRVEALEHHP